MSIKSMTGFARAEGDADACSWTWEVKSVNGRGLDVRCRLPTGFEGLEPAARKAAAARLGRGNVTIALNVRWRGGRGSLSVNREALDQVIGLLPEIRQCLPDAPPPRIEGLLALRGVVETVEEGETDVALAALEPALLGGLDAALESLVAMRAEEGARLDRVLVEQLDAMETLCAEADVLAALQPDAIRARLENQVRDLLGAVPALPEERLAQEAALLMTKADVREELDRLKAHHAAARDLLGEDGSVGRKLDFLCQELNREASTLCAKAVDVELTRVGLGLKAAVDRLREQVQNIE